MAGKRGSTRKKREPPIIAFRHRFIRETFGVDFHPDFVRFTIATPPPKDKLAILPPAKPYSYLYLLKSKTPEASLKKAEMAFNVVNKAIKDGYVRTVGDYSEMDALPSQIVIKRGLFRDLGKAKVFVQPDLFRESPNYKELLWAVKLVNKIIKTTLREPFAGRI